MASTNENEDHQPDISETEHTPADTSVTDPNKKNTGSQMRPKSYDARPQSNPEPLKERSASWCVVEYKNPPYPPPKFKANNDKTKQV